MLTICVSVASHKNEGKIETHIFVNLIQWIELGDVDIINVEGI